MSAINVNLTRFTPGGVQQHPLIAVIPADTNGFPSFGGGTIASGQVSVNGSEVSLRTANLGRRSLTGTVTGNSVWIGPVGVTSGTGLLVNAGGSFNFNSAAASVFKVISSAAATISWLEEIAD